ncbi:hypothetical protein [Kribbella italica]|uniref:Uncharacterized protein n=1 Tax=Kribbella italica TaxID=1540520 RepID=A0A7W9J6P3_9ACTN|nr:hypothetical protein [Kribbella italica]MBB5836127.1 hypothetical protein [Kribbella italica]
MDLLWLIGVMVVALALLWVFRKKSAKAEVDRLVQRGGLPPEPELVAGALRWHERRQGVLVGGTLIGVLVGGAIIVLADQALEIDLVASDGLDVRLLTWMLAAAAAAGGVTSLLHSYRSVLAVRDDGPRIAALRQRRLTDYLSPVEVAVHYSAVLLPLVAVALGLVVLGSDDHPSSGWILIVSGLMAVPLCVAGLWLQRLALEVNQTSSGEAELRWQEALRAATLRDLGVGVVSVSWLLGASVPLSFEWPSDVPGFVEPIAAGLFVLAMAALCVVWSIAASRRGLQRAQRVA